MSNETQEDQDRGKAWLCSLWFIVCAICIVFGLGTEAIAAAIMHAAALYDYKH